MKRDEVKRESNEKSPSDSAYKKTNRLDRLEHRACVANLVLTGAFDVQDFDDAINDVGSVTCRACAHAAGIQIKFQTKCFGPLSRTVTHHANLASGFLLTAPGAHDKSIIDTDTPNFIHACSGELCVLLHVTRHMFG